MSVQEKQKNVQKNARLEIRINSKLKEELQREAKNKTNGNLTKLLLNIIRTRNRNDSSPSVHNVRTDDFRILKEGILELNKFLEFNQDILSIPEGLDFDKIMEAIKKCHTI